MKEKKTTEKYVREKWRKRTTKVFSSLYTLCNVNSLVIENGVILVKVHLILLFSEYFQKTTG